jgi:hypothetical protein
MQGQSLRHSWWEAWANIAVGFGVNFTANMLLLPLFGFHTLTWHSNLIIGGLYTAISLVRSFILRRAFNRLHLWQYHRDRLLEEPPLGEEASVVIPSERPYIPE